MSPLPNGGARNAMEETIVKPRGGGGGRGGGSGILTASPPGENTGAGGSTLSDGVGDGAGSGRRVRGSNGFVSGAPQAKAAVDGKEETGQPPAPRTQQQEPPKKRRNLDLVKPGGRGAAAAAPAGAGGRVELFMPQYACRERK